MSRYNFRETEAKWQRQWKERRCFEAREDPARPKYYVLEMFPYPSGQLHVGHVRNYTMGDLVARYRRAQGFNVLHPMGWDAFGLPAENAAIEAHLHPAEWTHENIRTMQSQIEKDKADLDRMKAEFDRSEALYKENVRHAKDYIRAGDIFQVVLSQRFERRAAAAPFSIYRALRRINPSPYMYYVDFGEVALAGASPEMLVRVEGDRIRTRPIAGTRPRGRDEEEDLALEDELRTDPKERAEHVMLVDLGRNDLGRVSRPGTVEVSRFMGVERFSHVMHLVSEVTGRLRADRDAFDGLLACFPAGTVSGAPKVRAMEIIEELETSRRGPYAGAIGYVDYSGNLDSCITIRTTVLARGVAHVQAGAGIVADSVPQQEYRECVSKAGALIDAIERAEARA